MSSIDIHKDSTFTYYLWAGVEGASFSVHGSWHKNNNELIFNSYNQPLVAQEKGECDSVVIKVMYEGDVPAPFAIVVLKSEGNVIYGTETNFDGKATLKVNNADSIVITNVGCYPAKYPIDSSTCYQSFRLYEGSSIIMTDKVYIIQDNAICPKTNDPDNWRCLVKKQ